MANIDYNATNEGGAGYSDQNIDDNGVAKLSSAMRGYDNGDGTYTYKSGNKWKQKPIEMLPINTGDADTDDTNRRYNDALASIYTDSTLEHIIGMYDETQGGTAGREYREGMDDYQLHDIGTSKYDDDPNAMLTTERNKLHRNDEQTTLAVLGNALPKMQVRAASTVGVTIGSIIEGVANCFGGSNFVNEYLSPNAFNGYADSFGKIMDDNVPIYSTQEQDESSAMSATRWTSGSHWAMMIDNVGFTVGAALAMRLTGGLGPTVATGLAGAQVAGATVKALSSQDAKERTWWENLLPVATGIITSTASKFLPPAIRNKVATLATGIVSASGEAEVEAMSARDEFIKQKTAAIDANINARKNEVRAHYAAEMAKALTEEDRDALQVKMDNQLSILDWQRTKAINHEYSDTDDLMNITRFGNMAILTASNLIQFGKLMNGGFKTFQTNGKAAMTSEAKTFVNNAYRNEMSKAGWNIAARREVARRKDDITADALKRFVAGGGKAFDDAKKITAGELARNIVKHPLTEGMEEINQAAIANMSKAYAERNTDDYYGQISGLEMFRRAEDAWTAAFRSLSKTYSSEDAWSEFCAGAIMGAMGVPWLRSAKFKRSSGELDENGEIKTVSKWRSPIFLQGGIYEEVKKARYDKENMGKMAEKLNTVLTEEGRQKFLKNFGYIAHQMQYAEDKEKAGNAIFENKKGDKYRWMNADDAELVSMVELFQNTGRLGLLKAMVRTNLEFETAQDLRILQDLTTTLDEKGNKNGPYSSFDLSEDNGSEADKKRLNDEVKKMREKLHEQADRYQYVIDTYSKARAELQMESDSGLSDENMNCLAWYRTRLAMFDSRTKDMYEKHKDGLGRLNKAMPDIFKDLNKQLTNGIEAVKKNASMDDNKKQDVINNLEKTIATINLAEMEWNDRWERAQKVDDDMSRARILFVGNEKADPIGDTPAEVPLWLRKPFWMSQSQWAKRVNNNHSEAAQRRRALMGFSLDHYGSEEQLVKGVIDNIIEDMNRDVPETRAIRDVFSDDNARKEFATALNDMRQCQAAVVRYKDLYQFYKDNPYASAARKREEEEKVSEEAERQEVEETKDDLDKCKTIGELYDAVAEQLKAGKDPDTLTDTLEKMAKNGNKVAEQLLKNQEYVRVFAKAVEAIRIPEAELKGDIKPTQIGLDIMKSLILDAGRTENSTENMHKYVESRLAEITKDGESFSRFLIERNLVEEAKADDFDFSTVVIEYDEEGNKKGKKRDSNNKLVKIPAINGIRQRLPELLNIIDDIIKERLWKKAHYTLGKGLTKAKTKEAINEVNRLLNKDQNSSTVDLINRMTQIGHDTSSSSSQSTSQNPINNNSVKTPSKQEQKEQPKKYSIDLKESLEDGVIIDDATESKQEQVKQQEEAVKRDAKDYGHIDVDIWIPAVPYFDTAFKNVGKTVRMDHVAFNNGMAIKVTDPQKSPYGKFFSTLERIRVFKSVDEAERENPEAIKEGEDVYFIIDKVQDGQAKSEILGLKADEVAYKGSPIVWMCVKRGSRYQAIGSLSTDKSRLKRFGQEAVYDEMVAAFNASGKAYVYEKTGKVKSLHQGLVETQDEENSLRRVYGGNKPRLAIRTRSGLYTSKEEQVQVDENSMKLGRVYALVKDNATDKDIPMPCRIAHFNNTDKKRVGKTVTWSDTENAIRSLINSAKQDDFAKAKEAVNGDFVTLNSLLALLAYGIHIDVQDNDGKRSLILSKTVFKDGLPVPARDKTTGEVLFQKDEDGNIKKDNDGKGLPLYERKFVPIPLQGGVDSAKVLMDILMTDDFNPPFRITIDDITSDSNQKINDGILTTNIVDEGGLNTKGCYVQVSVEDLNVKEQTKKENSPEDYGITSKNASGELTKVYDSTDYYLSLTKQVGGTIKVEVNGLKVNYSLNKMIPSLNETVENLLRKVVEGEYGSISLYNDSGSLLIQVGDDAYVVEFNTHDVTVTERKDESIENIESFYKASQNMAMSLEYLLGSYAKGRPQVNNLADLRKYDEWFAQVLNQFKDANSINNLCKSAHQEMMKSEKNENDILEKWVTLKEYGKELENLNGESIIELANTVIDSHIALKARDRKANEERNYDRLSNDSQTHININHGNKDNGVTENDIVAIEDENISSDISDEIEESETDNLADETQESETIEESTIEKPEITLESLRIIRRRPTLPDIKNIIGDFNGNLNFNSSLTDSEKFSTVNPQDDNKPRIDVDVELKVLREIVPGLTRDEAVMITDRLIETGRKGVVAQGVFKNGLMVLSRQGVRGTAFHEAFHGIYSTALSDEERKSITEEAKRLYGVKTEADAEEAMADAFRDYMVDETYGKSWSRRIRDFFRALFNLSTTSYARLRPVIFGIFSKIKKGGYINAGMSFSSKTLKESRLEEYRQMGLSRSEIDFLENGRGGYGNRPIEVRQMLDEAGVSEDAFDALSEESRDNLINCL